MSPQTTELSQHAGRSARPLLVGGCPRSGTTLLRSMLNSHPELALPRETRFVIEAFDRRRTFGDLGEADNRRRLAHWIFDRNETWSGRLGLDHEQAVERLVEAPPTLGSVLATPFLMHAERLEKPRWGDKRPSYAARMEVVWSLFPHAQFVNVVRDPRACAASMRKVGWNRGSIAAAVDVWLRALERVDAWRPRLGADQLLDVRYEDLVSEPERSLSTVATFAGITSDEAAIAEMLTYHARDEELSQHFHSNLSRPPDPERTTAWRDVLEPDEVAFVEAAAGPRLGRFGYEATAGGVSPRARLLHTFRSVRWGRRLARRSLLWTTEMHNRLVHRQPLAAVPLDPAAPSQVTKS